MIDKRGEEKMKKKIIFSLIEHLRICHDIQGVATISSNNCKILLEYILELRDHRQEAIELRQELQRTGKGDPQKKKVTIVSSDDWDGLYIDDVLVYEGHSIPIHIAMAELGIKCGFVDVDEDWLQKLGQYPTHLHELKGKK